MDLSNIKDKTLDLLGKLKSTKTGWTIIVAVIVIAVYLLFPEQANNILDAIFNYASETNGQ